ncbi:MAG: GMC family oxidoreductase N-terminal domain-containing protein [Proteobacteria bacterium]|nr:GMC family oxidoreductase N-terminal domain-containing protein [Pseudomonadota bacterium]
MSTPEYDYIIVGSGAGGGPLAANLAKAGHRVLLMEAGGDDETDNYRVPAFNGQASEDPLYRWDFFVKHYSERPQRDSKYVAAEDGILYPRCGTLGGCTAHNAMITVLPHDSDWNHIAEITGDATWLSGYMYRYWQRLEACRYVSRPAEGEDNPSGHGYDGWLSTEMADPALAITDPQLTTVLVDAVLEVKHNRIERIDQLLGLRFDPNDRRVQTKSPEGLALTPIATHKGQRAGARDAIRSAQQSHPENLTVQLHSLVTRVLLDEDLRATGVEYLEGASLYRADPRAAAQGPESGARRQVLARREVILCGGAFNTPQLLKLSGIGPRAELEKFGIAVRVELPGVGENLQDRYEVGVASEMRRDFRILNGASFRATGPDGQPDPAYVEWQQGKGLYVANGAVIGIIKRSTPDRPEPDLYIFGLPSFFRGYYPGYSEVIGPVKNHFTWAILKAHTSNCAGSVTLKSADPRDRPDINFRYFDEGNDAGQQDIDAVVAGVEFVREMNKGLLNKLVTRREVVPGPDIESKEQIAQFIKDEAWGHHASCTCRIGPSSDPMAVLDSRFRVYGTKGLRVVDASVFPKIPGFFIVTPVYMISEKASDVILADAAAD